MFTHKPMATPSLKRQTIFGQRFYTNSEEEFFYPSVTSVLSSANNEWLVNWRNAVGPENAEKLVKMASRRGGAVHSAMESHIKGTGNGVEEIQCSQMLLRMFNQIRSVVDENLTEIYLQEKAVVSHTLKVAGTVDLFGLWNGRPTIVDFKTSVELLEQDSPQLSKYFAQAVTYAMMVTEVFSLKIVPGIKILLATDDGYFQEYNVPKRDYPIHLQYFLDCKRKFDETLKEKERVHAETISTI